MVRLVCLLAACLPAVVLSPVFGQGPVLAPALPDAAEAVAPVDQSTETEPAEAAAAPAGEKSPAPAKHPESAEKRKQIAEQLRVAQKALDKAEAAQPAGAKKPKKLAEEVETLKQLDIVHAQLETAEDQHDELKLEQEAVEASLKELRTSGPAEERPYTFTLLERIRDELNFQQTREEWIETAVAVAVDALERAKVRVQEKERQRRRAKEALEANDDLAKAAKLAAALEEAKLQSETATETYELRQAELANAKLAEEIYQQRITFLTEKIALVTKDAVFTARDLQEQIAELDRREAAIKREIEQAESNGTYVDNQWFNARERLEADAANPELLEEVEAWRQARQANQQRITLLNQRLARLSEMRTGWNRRYEVITLTAESKELDTWEEETESILGQLEREARLLSIRTSELRKELATLDAKALAAEADNPEVAAWIRRQHELAEQLIDDHEAAIVSIESDRRLHEKLLADLHGGEIIRSTSEKLADVWDHVVDAWDYEITAVDDRPITVRKIVIGLLFIVVGFFLSRTFSRLFSHRVLRRVGVHPSGAAAIQSVLFYVLLIIFTVSALHFANVPLTAFTILGGAVALGIGFGSQTVIANFISGLILLAERPIRVGDMIELEGMFATVDRIGARSTRVTTGANLEIIVPNTKFLENNVINWTLSDDLVRTKVAVGVIYGSPTEKVTELLKKAAAEEPLVRPNPDPFVLFMEFGDNSLNFEVHFWIRSRTLMERLGVESKLRYRIDTLFREAGLVIAFPQRDVHIDTSGPLEVRMLTDEKAA